MILIMNEKQTEIVFPCIWEYRVFCQSAQCDAAESAIRDMGLKELKIEAGGTSGSGSYRTLRVNFSVDSKEEANKIGERLKKLDGVRFIL